MLAHFQSFLNIFPYSGNRIIADELDQNQPITYEGAIYIWNTTVAISSVILLSICSKKSTVRKPVDTKQTAKHTQHIEKPATEDDIPLSKTDVGDGTKEIACAAKTKKTKEQEGERKSAAEKQSKERKQDQVTKPSRRSHNKKGKTDGRESEMHDSGEEKRAKGKRQKGKKKNGKKHSSEELPEENENYPKPRKFVKGAKEKLIAKGSRAGRHEYQTMDDVVSDWGSDSENKQEEAKEKANNAKSLREDQSHGHADVQSKEDRSKLANSKDIVEERSKADGNNKESSKAKGWLTKHFGTSFINHIKTTCNEAYSVKGCWVPQGDTSKKYSLWDNDILTPTTFNGPTFMRADLFGGKRTRSIAPIDGRKICFRKLINRSAPTP